MWFTLLVTPSGSDPLDGLPLADLRRVVSALVAQVAMLQESVDRLTIQIAALQAENAALKDDNIVDRRSKRDPSCFY